MKRRKWLQRLMTAFVLSLLFVSLVGATLQPNPQPQGTILQTTINDWQQGTGATVDRRNLDALHTPLLLGDHPGGSVRLASQPSSWERQSTSEPALPRGGPGAWDEQNVAEAAVLHDGTQFMMWYSGQESTTNHWQIGLATSTNGLDWNKYVANPVLTVGAPGSWDDSEVSFSSIMYDGENYRSWYSGYSDAQQERNIGYAFSTNGINWTKHPTPVLSAGAEGEWDGQLVGNPTVLYDGAHYHLWYAGWLAPEGHWRIGHATSTNGLDWTKDAANPVLVPGSEGDWDDYHVTAPSVLYDGEIFHLWYAGWDGPDYSGDSYGRIGYALSPNGTDWTKSVQNPVLDPTGGTWDPQWAVDPEVIFDGDLYHLWYSGGITWTGVQIGYATAVPEYNNEGTYVSPLIDTACAEEEIPLWSTLIVHQQPHTETMVYALLDESGEPIEGFDTLWSGEEAGFFDLSDLSWRHERIYLRATFYTAFPWRSPVLEDWEIRWVCQPQPYHAFLALVRK